MEMVLVVALIVVIVVASLFIFSLQQQIKNSSKNSGVELLKADLTELTRGVQELHTGLNDTLTKRLDKNSLSMQHQLGESAKIVADVSRRLAKLDDTNKRVVDVADELKTLQNVLQNPHG